MNSLFRKVKAVLGNMSLFQKMIAAFICVIVLPISISYITFQQATGDIIVSRVCDDTLNSISLVANSVDSLVEKMISVALYVSTDEKIKQLLTKDVDNETRNYEKLLAINEFNNLAENISYNMIGVKNYITLVAPSKSRYTNWNIEGQMIGEVNEYFENLTVGKLPYGENRVVWRNIEINRIYGNAQTESHVITLTKLVNDASTNQSYGFFMLSIPEIEFSKLIMDEGTNLRFILDEELRIIAAADKSLLGKSLDHVSNAYIPSDVKGWFVTDSTEDGGAKSLITYHKIKKNGWQIVDIKSYDTITGELSAVNSKLLAISLCSMAFFVCIALFIARGITRPLNGLSKMMLGTDLGTDAVLQELADRSLKNEVKILEESFNIMTVNLKRLMKDNIEKEKKKREYEIKSLQAQIMPHFLFNTLNTIRWAAINNKKDKAAEMTLALIRLLRMTITDHHELIPVEMEVENLKSYVKIMQMRQGNEFNMVYDITDSVLQYRIPKLLLQPLVENSILHGFKNVTSDKTVGVSGFENENEVILQIWDNGCGFDTEELLESRENSDREFSGIGIANVVERIKLYYGMEYGLRLQSKPGCSTLVEIFLPKIEKGAQSI